MCDIMAFYKPGDRCLQTVVVDGKVQYTDKTLEEYIREYPDHLYLPIAEAIKLMQAEIDKRASGQWRKIDFKTWLEALNVLPPEKWLQVNDVEIFRMSEYISMGITAHYAKVPIWGDRYYYFTAVRKTSTPYEDLSQEVMNYAHSLQNNESRWESNPLLS